LGLNGPGECHTRAELQGPHAMSISVASGDL
jgi:hypothetical protein